VPVIQTGATAAVAFAATNIDDIIVLSVLFARRDKHFRTRHIVIGQYLGFAVLIGASLAASLGLLALPAKAVGALGLIPIALGLRGLWRARRGNGGGDTAPGRKTLTTTTVASITIANGADNVAIYAPLFATIGTGGITTTVIVFFALIAFWCAVAVRVGSRPIVIRVVDWAGHYAIPVVLIALGIYILAKSGLPQSLVK
jgi:cadmium resistance transport/sequestration family protein